MPRHAAIATALTTIASLASLASGRAQDTIPTDVASRPTDQSASRPTALEPFEQQIPGTAVRFEMVPIPSGVFTMGSPDSEPGREAVEGPQRRVRIDAFWMGRCEVTWDEYELWGSDLERQRRAEGEEPSAVDIEADAITRPTPPYTDMTFGMGRKAYPAICMTQLAATTYCEWLSIKTDRSYRLPSEAEWEYACRAGTTTKYSFGDDATKLGDFAWFGKNSDDQYQRVGTKKPNPWGLHDMHGNIAEWVLDQLAPYAESAQEVHAPVVQPTELYPRVVRGGSWEDAASACRAATRVGSERDWKMQDPQIPKSVWYHTDAIFVGFRVVCVP